MQGKLVPSRLDITGQQSRDYFASTCGLCQQLREDYGVLARFLVNNDALVLQLLTEAQSEAGTSERQIRCGVYPLKHAATSEETAARYAAAVSVMLAHAKVQDAIDDARGVFGFFVRIMGCLIAWLMAGWVSTAQSRLRELGFDPDSIHSLQERQKAVEDSISSTPTEAAEPTAVGVGALFAHTAQIADRPENTQKLSRLGESVGQAIYLLDAAEDLKADERIGNFNPFHICLGDSGTSVFSPWASVASSVDGSKQAAGDALASMELKRHEDVLQNIFQTALTKRAEVAEHRAEEGFSFGRMALSTVSGVFVLRDCCDPNLAGCCPCCPMKECNVD